MPYRPGRGTDWRKIKCLNRAEFIVVGFTDPERTRQGFGALLVGYYDRDGQLRYAGKVGTGFNTERLVELRPRLDKIEQRTPTVTLPKSVSKKGVHWAKPTLVTEVQYGSITTDKILRHASFQGLREDKGPQEIGQDTELRAGCAASVVEVEIRGLTLRYAELRAPLAGLRLNLPERIVFVG